MSTSFTVHRFPSQISRLSVSNLSVNNLNVSTNTTFTTGGFTVSTVKGLINYSSGSVPLTNYFVNSLGEPLEIPKGSIITQTTLAAKGESLFPSSGSFIRVYLDSPNFELYKSTTINSLNTGKLLVLSKEITDDAILKNDQRVYAESSKPITKGTLYVTIQYQIPR